MPTKKWTKEEIDEYLSRSYVTGWDLREIIRQLMEENARLTRAVERVVGEHEGDDCPGAVYTHAAYAILECPEECQGEKNKDAACWREWLMREEG